MANNPRVTWADVRFKGLSSIPGIDPPLPREKPQSSNPKRQSREKTRERTVRELQVKDPPSFIKRKAEKAVDGVKKVFGKISRLFRRNPTEKKLTDKEMQEAYFQHRLKHAKSEGPRYTMRGQLLPPFGHKIVPPAKVPSSSTVNKSMIDQLKSRK